VGEEGRTISDEVWVSSFTQFIHPEGDDMTTASIKTAPRQPIQTAHAVTRSPYHLSEEQIAFFDENGYLILRGWIPKPLLARLQEAGQGWIERGWAQYQNDGERTSKARWDADWAFAEREGKTVMWRVNYLHDKGFAASLELLGSPEVLGIAESLCGPNFVPTYESMVFKQQGDGKEVIWHQDAIHPRNHRIFNLDVYLDASRGEAGALLVVPKSHTVRQDFCDLETVFGWDVPDAIVVEMEPGDVLLHDVMVAHGSPATRGAAALRRTLYYEFRPAEQILSEGPWDRDWIDKRLRLVPVALRLFERQFPDATQFAWNPDADLRPQTGPDDEAELRIIHTVHTESAFCSAGDVIPNAVSEQP
jgi:ectoine hydroxylase-related dioxygenase (phytanoyl-CoA dioxygenase family)